LDKTLIPFDSFRSYLFRCIRFSNLGPALVILLFRKLRLLQMDTFKKKIITLYRKNNDYQTSMEKFAAELYQSINGHVLEAIYSHTDNQTINILVSASPEDYVREFCKKMNWEGMASTLQGDYFNHVYGLNKINLLKAHYDPQKYNYNFAISDHDSDDELLKLFEIKAKFLNNKVVYL